MSREIELRCRCGEVGGRVAGATPRSVNHAICYCDDCQAFAHHLGRADLLDEHGGTDIVQVAPASLRFDRGMDRISGLRLSPKGLYRWYARCCQTPVGNCVDPKFPFVGIVAQGLGRDAAERDEVLGPSRGGMLGKYAVGEPPPGTVSMNWPLLGHAVRNILGWKMRGETWPHPFFERDTRAPRYALATLSREAREALRPLCGPKPA